MRYLKLNSNTEIIIINGVNSFDINKLDKYVDSLYKKEKINKCIYEKRKMQAILSEILIRVIYYNKYKLSNKSIKFNINKGGKPFIESNNKFYFNISHSNDLIVAIIDNEDVGVDVEYIKDLSIEKAEIFCSDYEYSLVKKEKNDNKNKLITYIWGLKESYMKYLGIGMVKNLRLFDVINKKNINNDVFLYSYQYKNYIISTCTKKDIFIGNVIREININDLVKSYDKIYNK